MSQATLDIVQKLWNLCNILRDDGVTYHQYVTELTYLLFLKMAKETGTEDRLPQGYRWDQLEEAARASDLNYYRELLLHLGTAGSRITREIFAGATTVIRKPRTLAELVSNIDALDWYTAKREGLGELYEGLLEKNASEKKSGAGQYFTPRVLIDVMVELMQPRLGEVIQDPAAGTGGFLISAYHYLKKHNDFDSLSNEQYQRLQGQFHGMEFVHDAYRLALMNLMLHDLEADGDIGIRFGDTLSSDGEALPKADLILTNPPFGTKKGGGLPTRTDFTYPTSNKQLAFLQHIYRGLKPGGRAAVVLPDNVLFESGVGRDIRRDLMDKCHLHTLLRLPTGIFYAQGVKTNVLFFTKKSDAAKAATPGVWVYDLRANMPAFGKRTPLTRQHFADFIAAYGPDPGGLAPRTDTGEMGRFRHYTREAIAARDDSLDLAWLKDDSAHEGEWPEPEVLAREAMAELEGALADLRELMEALGVETVE